VTGILFLQPRNRLLLFRQRKQTDSEEKKENIYFVFEDERYDTYEEFIEGVEIEGKKLFYTDTIIEILRAGIIDGEPMIKTPWGDARLAKMAVK